MEQISALHGPPYAASARRDTALCKRQPDGDKTQLAEQQDELSELRKRVAELEEENYILKKRRPSSQNTRSENHRFL
jgi:transposase-like protein